MYWKTVLKDCKMDIVDSFTGIIDMDYYENNSKDSISFDVYADELDKYGYTQGQTIFENCTEKRILDMNLKTGDKVILDVYMISEKAAARYFDKPIEKLDKYDVYFVDIASKET